MLDRRGFLGALALSPVVAPIATLRASHLPGMFEVLSSYATSPAPAERVAGDEDFWFQIQEAFTVDRTIINLNNGGVSPALAVVQNSMKKHLDFSHRAPAYNMWRILEPQKETVRSFS